MLANASDIKLVNRRKMCVFVKFIRTVGYTLHKTILCLKTFQVWLAVTVIHINQLL